MKWLISELQTRMKISSKSSVEEQIELFTEHWNSGAKDQSFKTSSRRGSEASRKRFGHALRMNLKLLALDKRASGQDRYVF